MRSMRWLIICGLLLLAVLPAQAEDFGEPAFQQTWLRSDYPVQQGRVERSWTWGPQPFTPVLREWYVDSPGQHRPVQYLDKSRMELNAADANGQWAVTNGLLVKEMITGQVQVGDNKFITLDPADVPLAGDPTNPFPRYNDLQRIYGQPTTLEIGGHADRLLTPDGFEILPQYSDDPATQLVTTTGPYNYPVPQVFWNYMQRSGLVYVDGQYVQSDPLWSWVYVLGYPIAEPYWARVQVGGVEHEVMFQAFERRILTYTPSNPAEWQVEMGNVGQHYYRWRYAEPFVSGKQAVITAPELSSVVTSPLLVQGFENGTAFEARVTVHLRTASGEVLGSEATSVYRPDIGVPGPFEVQLNFTPPPTTTPGQVEIVVFSPRDGTPQVLAAQSVMIAGR